MRLREAQLSLRVATRRDVLDRGEHLAAIDAIFSCAGCAPSRFVDLSGPRKPPRPVGPSGCPELSAHVGAGLHQATRFRVEGDGPTSFELNAGLHPYTGVYVVQIDARMARAAVESRPGDIAALAASLVRVLDPLTLNVHDADDDAIAHVDSPTLVALGWGPDAHDAAEDRPGREWVRGHFRFAPTWITYLGPESVDVLRALGAPLPGEPEWNGGRSFTLGDTPFPLSWGPLRAAQRALRAELGLDDAARRDPRHNSYWKRKR